MAPIKFEEHMKEKLDDRTIQPSAGSWEKLNSRLDDKKNSGKKWWISAVAAVAVLLIASVLFVDQQRVASPTIVETPSEEEIQNSSENIKAEEPQLAAEEIKPTSTSDKSRAEDTEKSKPANIERLASNRKRERDLVEPIATVPLSGKEKLNAEYSENLQELIGKVVQEKKESGNISEAEVDALLAEAVKEISNETKTYQQSKLDPNELLAEAEDEIYQSFKEKVFEIVKSGYQKAAVAVSNKLDNNQNQ